MRRRLQLWRNRLRIGYRVERHGRRLRVAVPAHKKKWISALKLAITIIGLVSAFFVFGSVWYAFAFGLGLFLVGTGLEKIIFVHYVGFIHALPLEEMDPSQWVGISFGSVADPHTGAECNGLAMVVTQRVYAERMSSLVLEWTEGAHDDIHENVGVSIVELSENSYVFLCFPRMNRPMARGAFVEAKAELRKSSLEDELAELHAITVFGKKCHLSARSPYPQFSAKYKQGEPVVLGFGVPHNGDVMILTDIPTVKIHAFRIVKESALTRRDFEKDAIGPFVSGGEWQGPPELAPPERG